MRGTVLAARSASKALATTGGEAAELRPRISRPYRTQLVLDCNSGSHGRRRRVPDLLPGGHPDDDIVSLRWIVDGVLLEDTYPTIPFTEAHEITAVVRDARGATTTDTKLVTCI